MKIDQFTEARMAPLYHWISGIKASEIFHHNKLEGRWTHKSPLSDKEMVGTSMSRNQNFIWGGTIRLVFDQWKLDQTNKIVPLDADYTWEYTTYGPKGFQGDVGPRRDRERRAMSDVSQIPSSVLYPMAEEFVLGDVEPLNKYLIRIDLLPGTSAYAEEDAAQYSEKFNVPIRDLPQPDFIPTPRAGSASPKFSPPIREAREAPLYHWVDTKKAQAVVQADAMPARHVHRLPWTDEKTKGTSMSRNAGFKFGFNKPWRFVFDQGKLSQTNKIVPVDAQAVHRYTITKDDPTWDKDGTSKFSDVTLKDRNLGKYRSEQFAEEFILGDIAPLSRYLIRIDHYPDTMKQAAATRLPPPGMDRDKYAASVERMVRKYAKQHRIPYRVSEKEVWRK